jgi:RNA polymerase sigma-70 factor (ECF subfamily)
MKERRTLFMDIPLAALEDLFAPEPYHDDAFNVQAMAVRARADPSAFALLYDHFFARVYNYARYRVHDAQTADDLTAQIFERVLRYLSTYKPQQGPFGAWLFAIARSVVSNYHRSQNRWRWLSWDRLREHPSEAAHPEAALEQRDQQAQLLQAVATLDQRERDLIALRFGSGLSNRQIADLTGLGDSNVGVILHRALRKLRHQLTPHE